MKTHYKVFIRLNQYCTSRGHWGSLNHVRHSILARGFKPMWKSVQFHRFVCAALSASLLLISALPGVTSASVPCADEDRKYATRWGINPEHAYKFGLTIKQLVADRDLAGLFELAPDELQVGPRKKFIENKTFDQVFTEDWRSTILASEPPCSPVGWRGFMLANGLVWYRFDTHDHPDIWQIISMNGVAEEKYTPAITDPAWRAEGKVIPPECFVEEWISSDNFEAYEDTYGIEDSGDFRKYPGKYFGREISRIEPITAWGGNIYLATVLGDCPITFGGFFDNVKPLIINAGYVSIEGCNENYCLKDSYRLLAQLSQVECQNLAPHLPGQCESAYLVETVEQSRGSIGAYIDFNFYGLFHLEDGRKAIVPLANFQKENDARNFLDELRGS